jgi:hypothetical protein
LDNISTTPVILTVGSQHKMADAHGATIAPIASTPAPPASSETEHPAPPSATVALLDLPTAETHDLIYCCRKCRTALFRPSQLQAPHDTGKHSFAYRKMTKDRESDKAGGPSSACTSYFLQEALPWMADTSVDVEGKLSCYKCKARVGKWYTEINVKLCMHPIVFGCMHGCVHLHRRDKLKLVRIQFLSQCHAVAGSLNWAGSQCSCGTWIAPAIQMNKKSVDERYFPKSTSAPTSGGAGHTTKS